MQVNSPSLSNSGTINLVDASRRKGSVCRRLLWGFLAREGMRRYASQEGKRVQAEWIHETYVCRRRWKWKLVQA